MSLKEQKGKKTKEREQQETSINKEVMERDWARKAKENSRKEREGGREGGRGRRRQISYLRKPPWGWAPENPQTRLLLPPSPPDRPLPLCPAWPGSVGFPAVGLFLKTPTPSPARPSHCGHRGLSQAQGPHPAVGREGGVKEGKQPQANRRPQPWGAKAPGLLKAGKREQDTRPTQTILEAKSWAPG